MDQGVIATFKCLYLRRTIQQLVQSIDDDPELSMSKFWKNFTIVKSIENIFAWNGVTQKCMNGCWRRIWPGVVSSLLSDDIEAGIQSIQNSIVEEATLANI